MVKNASELRLIEDELSRQLSFAKRRNGLIKKALELHMVCDVDAIFVAFSPSGRLSYFCGNKRVEDVLSHFIALPENTRNFHIPDLELQSLFEILGQLKEQTQKYILTNSNISVIQKEICQVKEEIQRLSQETRIYEPIEQSIMTIEEANLSKETLEKTLEKVQERKIKLEEDNHQGATSSSVNVLSAENYEKVASDQPAFTINKEGESSLAKSNEIQWPDLQLGQPIENSGQNQQTENSKDSHKLPRTESVPLSLAERLILHKPVEDAPSPYPQLSGTTFTSLLCSADVAETSSAIKDIIGSESLEQNASSFQQNQLPNAVTGDANPEENTYVPRNLTGVNQRSSKGNDTFTFGGTTGCEIPSNPVSSNLQLPSSPASFQVPQQMHYPMHPPYYYYPMPPMHLGSSSNVSPYNQMTLQQNPTPYGQGSKYLGLYAPSGMHNMYLNSGIPAYYPGPPNWLMNHQVVGNPNNVGSYPSPTSHMQLANYPHPVYFESEGSSSSSPSLKRKYPWGNEEPLPLQLSSYPIGNTAMPSNRLLPPTPRPISNGLYSPEYAAMGLPSDPHLRNFLEMQRKDDGNQPALEKTMKEE